MSETSEIWKPGSFTKNYSWGRNIGLRRLHEAIRIGFEEKMEDVPRDVFRQRLVRHERPDYIPANFFLFNKIVDGTSYLVADELVFQALNYDHSVNFDKLALFVFNLSYSGVWKGATREQRRPALWAFHYIKDRVAGDFRWDTSRISAPDIDKFVSGDSRYKARYAGKLSTNLYYMYQIGSLSQFKGTKVERWWTDAVFLALDRIIEDRNLDGRETPERQYRLLLSQAGFAPLAGLTGLERDLALGHLTVLYAECGSRDRFSEDFVRERTAVKLPDLETYAFNDARPQGAVHPTSARIVKAIPRACAMLARYSAGFEVIDADDLTTFDPESYARERTREALRKVKAKGSISDLSVEEFMKLTRVSTAEQNQATGAE